MELDGVCMQYVFGLGTEINDVECETTYIRQYSADITQKLCMYSAWTII
jgi:hypothetical protein